MLCGSAALREKERGGGEKAVDLDEPQEQPAPMSPGRLISSCILVIVLCLLGWHLACGVRNSRSVARLETAARKRGEPITVQDLARSYPAVPDEENAHSALLKLWQSEDPEFWTAYINGTRPLPGRHKAPRDPDLPVFGGKQRQELPARLSPKAVAAMRRFLPARQAHLDAVRDALKRKHYRATYDFTEGYGLLQPQLALLKEEAQLFQLVALLAAEEGQTSTALDAIGDIVQVGHCLKKDPTTIGQVVRIACYAIAINTLQQLPSRQPLTVAECDRIDQLLDGLRPDDGMKKALVTERVFLWAVLDRPSSLQRYLASSGDEESREGPTRDWGLATGTRLGAVSGWLLAEKRFSGEILERAILCLNRPDFATNTAMEAIFAKADEDSHRFPPKPFTALAIVSLAKCGIKVAHLEALRRCALATVAIERQRSRGVTTPTTLEELPGLVCRDPFNGQPLRVKLTEHGYVIYSVGPDRKDNGGVLEPLRKTSRPAESDIGFRVEHLDDAQIRAPE